MLHVIRLGYDIEFEIQAPVACRDAERASLAFSRLARSDEMGIEPAVALTRRLWQRYALPRALGRSG
jgi:hypothetical protein